MRLGFDSRRAQKLLFCKIGDCIVVLSQIVALLTPVRFRVAEQKEDVVAEWLTRLTANQFLSGAQVRVLPTSLIFLEGSVVQRQHVRLRIS